MTEDEFILDSRLRQAKRDAIQEARNILLEMKGDKATLWDVNAMLIKLEIEFLRIA